MPEQGHGYGSALDQRAMARAFDRASAGYDAAATLQATVRAELLERVAEFGLAPRAVLDLGTGTGHGAAALKRRWRRALVVALDLAPGMLLETRSRSRLLRRLECVRADAAVLPLRDGALDLVFSSLMLQWCDLDRVLAEVRRTLAPGGLLLFSTLGPATLSELRESWAAADDRVHVNDFIDMHDIGSALARAGYTEPVLDVDRHTLWYGDAVTLMRDLKAIGAHNVASDRSRGLAGRRRLDAVRKAYERHRTPRGLPATYEVVYGAAWRGADPGGPGDRGNPAGIGRPDTAAEVRIPAASIRRRPR